MGRRHQPRLKCILPVRIWGSDREGEPFVEHGCTTNISRTGLSLLGVRARLLVGDTIGLQYRNGQARFRIAWIIPASTGPGSHIGLECLQPERNLWPVSLPGEQPDTYACPEAHIDRQNETWSGRRSQMRFPVSGTAYVSKPGAAQRIPAKVGDISLDGCYLETSHPKSLGDSVNLLIRIGHIELEALGVVRERYAGTAMGIEFTFMSGADRHMLEHLIADLREFDTVS